MTARQTYARAVADFLTGRIGYLALLDAYAAFKSAHPSSRARRPV